MFRTSVPVTAEAFFDRDAELARLDGLVARVRARAPEWLAIVGPRKIGKTSLLLEWERRHVDPSLAFVVLDVMEQAPPSREFFRTYALHAVDAVLGPEAGVDLTAVAARPAEYRAALQGSRRFERLPPELRSDVLELPTRAMVPAALTACLELPERLAHALDLRVIAAIDEFQELASLASARPRVEPFALMRATWQRHRHVAYVISGSARTMLTELVTAERSPFFQHFAMMDLGPLDRRDAIALLRDSAPPGLTIDAELAGRAVDVVGGHPFYLQLLGEQLAAEGAPIDDVALKEALGALVFSRAGRLALYFENEYRRAVGRAASLAAVLAMVAAAPRRLGELATAVGAPTGAVTSYLSRLGDVVVRGDDERWRVADPVFALWLRWRAPGGAALPMTLVGDEAERTVAEALARLGFDLVYQSRASRGAFDLLATRGAHPLGVQVKRTSMPARLRAADWKRMHAEGARLGWRWIVAVVTPEGGLHFLDPTAVTAPRGGATLTAAAAIDNLLLWVDRPPARRGRAPARTTRVTKR